MATKKEKYQYMHEYLYTPFDLDRFQKKINAAIKALKDVNFDAIAFRGNSGALFAAPLALAMKKPLLMVRKKNTSHANRVVEGFVATNRYIIVDDFVALGTTIREIVQHINDVVNKEFKRIPDCAAVVTYQSGDNDDSVEDTIEKYCGRAEFIAL